MNIPIAGRILVIVALCLLTACRQQQLLSSSDIQLELSASDLLVGDTTLLVTVRDQDGEAIANPGALSIRGDMDHAGMVPVFAESESAVDGTFALPFEWTMAGGWIVEASLKLESGETVTRSFNFEVLNEAGGEMSNMEHSDMGQESMASMDHSDMSDMPGESSAVYLRIENRGEADARVVAVQSDAAAMIEFHRTIVENDIARMEPIEALTIPAGASLHLQPGGTHIMLRDLIMDLPAGATCAIQLELETGEAIPLTVPVMHMRMEDDATEIVAGDLVISQMWARPASAGSMAEHEQGAMGMESASE